MPYNLNQLYQTVNVRQVRWKKVAFIGKVFGMSRMRIFGMFARRSRKPKFKLSKPVAVVYTKDMEGMVERVLGHIVW